MSLVVRKSSPMVVRPLSEPATIKLSFLDKCLYKFPTTSLLVFEAPLNNAAETIRAALSRALVHYRPIAGRIITGAAPDDNDDDGDVHIECNDEGVVFVAASASYALKEVLCFDQSPGARKLLDELALYYPGMTCGHGDPLLLMQVTEFPCGGFVLAVTWNHGVADGKGMAQFLQAVGELARGSPSPSVSPVRWDDSLNRLPPSVLEAQDYIMNIDPLDADDLTIREVTIPMDSINRIKTDFSSSFHGQQCSTFEVALAILWQCRTRAISPDPETPTLLGFLADMRSHIIGAKGSCYYGNCVVVQLVMAKSGEVTGGDIKDLIMQIKHAKDRIPDRLKKHEGVVAGEAEELRNKLQTYDTMTVTSWRNLGFEQVDFGSGTPARVASSGRYMEPSPNAAGFLCNGKGGVSVWSALVREEHADAFLAELVKFM